MQHLEAEEYGRQPLGPGGHHFNLALLGIADRISCHVFAALAAAKESQSEVGRRRQYYEGSQEEEVPLEAAQAEEVEAAASLREKLRDKPEFPSVFKKLNKNKNKNNYLCRQRRGAKDSDCDGQLHHADEWLALLTVSAPQPQHLGVDYLKISKFIKLCFCRFCLGESGTYLPAWSSIPFR